MAIKQRISTATFTGWTKAEVNGTLSLVTFDGYVAIKLTKTGNSFNQAGAARTSGVQMLTGDRIYCKWQSDVQNEWFVEAMRNTSVLDFNSGSANFYSLGSDILCQYGDSVQVNSLTPNPADSWYDFYWEKQSDNKIYNFGKLEADSSYLAVGKTTSTDYNTTPVNLAFQGYYGAPNNYYLAEAYWTDSGLFTPPTPTTLSATATGGTTIDLTWIDVATSTNADEIVIFRDTTTNPTTEIDTVAIGVQSYSDSGLLPGTTYYYRVAARVTAYGSDWDSTYSSESSATTTTPSTDDFGADMLVLGEL